MIYIVQGRSGLIFIATTIEKDAKTIFDSIEGSIMSYWENGRCLFKDE